MQNVILLNFEFKNSGVIYNFKFVFIFRHLFRVSETKDPVDQSDAAILKKKFKKKRRLKEGEESWRCSDGCNGDTEMGEPSLRKTANNNGKDSKRGTGACEMATWI